MAERKKILFLSDHPLIPSGVGTQAKYLIEGLLETKKYQFLCLGGAIKHLDYRPQQVAPEKFGEGNWVIVPVDGHGNKDLIRQILRSDRPDAMVIFTDPRFFYWVWEMEDEIRSVCPLLYWHVWDNDPTPKFNKVFYDSTDHVVALSRKTYGLLQDLDYDRMSYVPHSIDGHTFKPLPEEDVREFRQKHYGPHADKFIVFWNNRNARRKQTGDVMESFARFAKEVGKQNVALFMHTAARDPEGQDIFALSTQLGIENQLLLSEDRVDAPQLNNFYNAADVTINIASNEGFGLGTLESLYAGTLIVVHMTGGLQFQIGDWFEDLKDFRNQEKLTNLAKNRWKSRLGKWWGVPVFPSVRNCVGSQQVPYIYDDRASNIDVSNALLRLYKMGRNERRKLGIEASQWARKTFPMDGMISGWDKAIEDEVSRFVPRREIRQTSI